MIVLTILFAGAAVLGALVGLGHIGQSIGGQSITAYGWGLCLNAAAISAFLTYTRARRA